MGKMIVLTFSDSEECAFEKIMDTLSDSGEIDHSLHFPESSLAFPGLEISLKEKTVYLNHTPVNMTYPEFHTLTYMARHPGWVFTKKQIYEELYEDVQTENIDNSIYCLIRGLRKKIEADPGNPKYIQTVRGIGYKFTIPEE
ncbi:transcriptional regulatory protein, C-terminal domain protein [Marvinbryantia formatexigens DSM 14469]|uniref:Transcriptional regulatory protein, C-terminal domain protein n=1 Tax=Marvinbryantia formatexigens DSM 14469 TaxID=478749 RepID=C6LJU9_9FIRM|nr:winged helix-turn-helix domain-containing protein [Marvinbryantia formatexigens]EET59027.1 transcriptional regulatory protein, C-terminal domain protein [Marvinbryantia formatexigens DSM 14469]UWO23572.1 winged helix-turn-helix domain-containing protein [Marvinbryantia formatexigens DSM 14469]SDG84458.1 Transcriptional regulatory protein, C terminal [Marvinbryantia formatexigens]